MVHAPARLAPNLARLAGRVIRSLSGSQPRDYRRGFYVLAVVLGALFLWIVGQGPAVQTVYGHDDLGFLDTAWKVRHGVLPHTDYHSALGALNPWIFAAGIALLGPTAAVLPFCITLVAVALGCLAWRVARERLSAGLALGFALTQAVVAMATCVLRSPWTLQSYAGYYNRQGYALVSILMLGLFLPLRPRDHPARGERRDGLTAGAILGVLLFLKVSYLLAGGAMCLAALGCERRFTRRWWWNLLLGFSVTALACLPLIRFDVLAMLRDLRMAAGARSENPYFPITAGSFLNGLWGSYVEILLLTAAQLLLRARSAPGEAGRREGGPSWASFATVTGVSVFLALTNMWGIYSEMPLLASWAFVLLGSARREVAEPAREPRVNDRSRLVSGVLLGGLWVFTFGNDALSLAGAASPWPLAWQERALSEAPLFDSASLKSLRIVKWARVRPPLPVPYAEKVNDGLRILRQLGGTHRVECMDFNNPFPFALQWPATHGGIWCWHVDFSFSEKFHPAPAEAFGDADVLMVPKYPGEVVSFPVMARLYGPYISAHFKLRAETAQWFVFQR